MAEYAPTTHELRAEWVVSRVRGDGIPWDAAQAEFNRWLAAHDAEVAAKALREAARCIEAGADSQNKWTIRNWLRDRAERIQGGAS
jgi:phage terminase Nu1 subunit (DNA packaging protein)